MSEATRADPRIHAMTLRRVATVIEFCIIALVAEVKPEDDEVPGEIS